MAILGGNAHFVIFSPKTPVWLFQFHLSVEVVKQFIPKSCILVQQNLFLFSVNHIYLDKMSVVCQPERRRRVIAICLCVCVCVCLSVCLSVSS